MPRPRKNTSDQTDETLALAAIKASLDERGFPPSQRELAQACGWSSGSSANELLRLMEARGLVKMTPGIPRALRITDAGMIALTERV